MGNGVNFVDFRDWSQKKGWCLLSHGINGEKGKYTCLTPSGMIVVVHYRGGIIREIIVSTCFTAYLQ